MKRPEPGGNSQSSFADEGVLAMTAQSDSDVWIFSEGDPLTDPLLLATPGCSAPTTRPVSP
jgi:hypothetical protein